MRPERSARQGLSAYRPTVPMTTTYAPTARFNAACIMSDNEMRKMAPFIFATATHESRSDRFRRIPTTGILRTPADEGFVPIGVKQLGYRNEGKRDFTKHPICPRGINVGKNYHVSDPICETLLRKAHNGASAYGLITGLYRIRCQDSLFARTSAIYKVKFRHSGDVSTKIIKGSYGVLKEVERTLATSQGWSAVKLTPAEQLANVTCAHIIHFGYANSEEAAISIQPKRLLIPCCYDDKANVLWTAFNEI